jgi:uncharacterized protein (TIGR02996 family)
VPGLLGTGIFSCSRPEALVTPDDAFLQDIIDSPDDDTPRLIYADWLEEHDQPERAEFIRVQCELARLSDDDGPALSERRDKLEATERLLLKAHLEEWAGPLRGRVDGSSFRRGFVAAIDIDAPTFLSQGDALLRAAPIQRATLRVAGADLRTLAGSPLLASIRDLVLSFWGVAVSVEGLRVFLDSPTSAAFAGSASSVQTLGCPASRHWSVRRCSAR